MAHLTPTHLPTLAPSYKPPTPNVLFNFSSRLSQQEQANMPSEFAGAHYDFGKQTWKGGNVIESHGGIESPSKDIQNLAPEGMTLKEAMDLAGKRGLASGRLWIQNAKSKLEPAYSTQSGFFLGNRYFLSAFHFNRDDELLNALKNRGSHRAVITSARLCDYPFGTTSRWVHLVGLDAIVDIMLWKLDDDDDLPKDTISCGDFMLFEGEESIPQFAGKAIWAVGYAGLLENEALFAKYVEKYYELMDIRQHAIIKDNKIPNYGSIFSPNERCLFLGNIPEKLTNVKGFNLPAEISAWNGLSGAMVAMFVKDLNDSSKWIIKIIGLMKDGEDDQRANNITSFTPGIKKMITEWMASSDQK
ncbi:MAG: hypothetical protein Q9187_004293 [Circinaria calcarea]